jgi:AcrR family transcriptional regulator
MSTPSEQRRSARSRQAILDSALELYQERGLAGMTMEGIARHAGVGKQTIYRWWPSKAAVLLEALEVRANPTVDFPDTGDLLADLRTQMAGVVELFGGPHFAPYVSLIAAAQEDPSIQRWIGDTIIGPRVRACRERLRRAQEQHQLREDVDLDAVVELLYAPLYYRVLLHTRPVSAEQVDSILSLAFGGLAPRRERTAAQPG